MHYIKHLIAPYDMSQKKPADVLITSGQYVPGKPGKVSEASRARASSSILEFIEVLQAIALWDLGTQLVVDGEATAYFNDPAQGSTVRYFLTRFQTACAPLFEELQLKSGIWRPDADQWNWRKVRVSLRHPRYDDRLVVHEVLIYPDGRCKYMFMIVGDHDDYVWHIDFDSTHAKQHKHMEDGQGVGVITTWSVNAMEDDRLRVPVLDEVMRRDPIADDYTFQEGDQFGLPEYHKKAQPWFRLGSTRVDSDGRLQWQVTAVRKAQGDSWMTEAELRAQLNKYNLTTYGALNVSHRNIITEHQSHAGTPVMLGKKVFPGSSTYGPRSIRIPDVAGEPHTEEAAGQITTAFNTIHSFPLTHHIDKDAIRILVSTEIGAGRTHVGIAGPKRIWHNLITKF